MKATVILILMISLDARLVVLGIYCCPATIIELLAWCFWSPATAQLESHTLNALGAFCSELRAGK
jgi:hypothetical protein